MTKREAMAFLACCLALPGCASKSTLSPSSHVIDTSLVSLDEAKRLISAGEVESIFQPHQGCVILTLRDGRILSFNQPHLDWVLEFIHDNGLEGKVGGVSIE